MKNKYLLFLGALLGLTALSNINFDKRVKADGERPQIEFTVEFDSSNTKQLLVDGNPEYIYTSGLKSLTGIDSNPPARMSVNENTLTIKEKDIGKYGFVFYVPYKISFNIPAYSYSFEVEINTSMSCKNCDISEPILSSKIELFDFADYSYMEPEVLCTTDQKSCQYSNGFHAMGDRNKTPTISSSNSIREYYMNNDSPTPTKADYYGGIMFYVGKQDILKQAEFTFTFENVEVTESLEAFAREKGGGLLDCRPFYLFTYPSHYNGLEIELIKDCELTTYQALIGKGTYTFDLKGHTLTTSRLDSSWSDTTLIFKNGTIKGAKDYTQSIFEIYEGTVIVEDDVTIDMTEMKNTNNRSLAYMRGGTLKMGSARVKLADNNPCIKTARSDECNIYIENTNFIYIGSEEASRLIYSAGKDNFVITGIHNISEIFIENPDQTKQISFSYNSDTYTGSPIRITYANDHLPKSYDKLFKTLDENALTHLNFTNLPEGHNPFFCEEDGEIVLIPENGAFTVYYYLNNNTEEYCTGCSDAYQKYLIPKFDIYFNHHSFFAWNTKADGTGTEYTEGQEIILKSDLTLYAIWTQTSSQKLDWFIGEFLRFDYFDTDVLDNNGACLGDNGYYALAKDYFLNELPDDEVLNLAYDKSEKYVNARIRFHTWANYNGEEIFITTREIIKSNKNSNEIISNTDNEILIIGTAILVISSYTFFRAE